MSESAVVAEVAAELRERNENLARIADRGAVRGIAPCGGRAHQRVDLDAAGDKLGEVVRIARSLNLDSFAGKSKLPVIGGLIDRLRVSKGELVQKFSDTNRQIEQLLQDVARQQGTQGQRVGEFDRMYDIVLDERRALGLHVAAGKLRLAELVEEQQKLAGLEDPDWHVRLQAIQQLEASEETLPQLTRALHNEKPQIRRWAAAKLAGVKTPRSVEALSAALLDDPNVGVRRTAGDSLSDIGDPAAEPAVCRALEDGNKLVRWRAARFLAEVGTEAALPFLEKARDDAEYEVRLEVEAAIRLVEKECDFTDFSIYRMRVLDGQPGCFADSTPNTS